MYIDLHCHTTTSDGKHTPTQLVKKAKQLGFSYIAKTDHDNVDSMPEFLKAGKKFKLNTIPGIEISSRYKDKALHIVGLGIDYKNKKIREYSQGCKKARKERGLQMVEKLKKLGWKIKYSEVDKNVVTRPHVANSVINHPANKKRLIKEFGQVPNFSNFIQKYLAKGKPAFVDKTFYMKPKPAIKTIHQAGGLAIIGHPQSKTPEFSYNKKHLQKVLNFDFDGLEVYAAGHTKQEIKYLKSIAKKHNLLISTGSDYHGYDEEVPLGICNNKYVDEKLCWELLKKLGY